MYIIQANLLLMAEILYQLRLAVYPTVSIHSRWLAGFLPPTVAQFLRSSKSKCLSRTGRSWNHEIELNYGKQIMNERILYIPQNIIYIPRFIKIELYRYMCVCLSKAVPCTTFTSPLAMTCWKPHSSPRLVPGFCEQSISQNQPSKSCR